MRKEITCPTCHDKFKSIHGNQKYCSDTCRLNQKAATQSKLYGIMKEFRKGFLDNYKLFERLLPKAGTKTLSLMQLNSEGFKPNCYYGTFLNDKKETIYKIAEYGYQVVVENQIKSIRIIKS